MDTETLAIAIGLMVSLMFTELYGLSGGGMIVPGYFALYLTKPFSIAMTLLAALMTYFIVRGLAQVAVVYGRRRIVLMVLFGFLVGTCLRFLASFVTGHLSVEAPFPPTTNCFCVVGFIIPGLIALWMDRQGMMQTLGPLMTSSVLVRLVLILVGVEIAS